ncbi:MAG: ATP-binding cassette domain-containing protein, partial [Oscillospiraceae bacterium]|nr:ATP-binding cassette domain-containing protein [Oscillospiraceae bacterium]
MKNKKPPLVLQMEATECGAASLSMILGYYGKNVPLEKLRIECGVSRDGVNAKNIAKVAMGNGLVAKAYKMNANAVKNTDFPVIIHWNMGHFVVLYGFNRHGALIADPAQGYVTIPYESFAHAFTGIVLDLKPGDNFEKNGEKKKSGGFIFSAVRSLVVSFFIAAVLIAIISIINFCIPFFNTVFIDKILMSNNTENLPMLIMFILVSMITVSAATVLYIKIADETSQSLDIKINSEFMWKIIKYPIEFFSQRNPGELTTRQADNSNIASSLIYYGASIPVDFIMIIIYVIIFFVLDRAVGIIGVISVAVNIITITASAKEIKNSAALCNRDEGVLQGNVSTAVNMIETIKACGCEDEIFEKLSGLGAKSANLKNEIRKTEAYSQVVFGAVNNLMYSAILVIGVYKVLAGNFTAGTLIGVAGIMSAFLTPIERAAGSVRELQNFHGAIIRSDDAMDYAYEPNFESESDNEITAENESGAEVKLTNLTFGYNVYDAPLIEDLNIEIKAGGSISFMGGSGSGKSTIAKLIAGLYTPWSGSIRYGGYTSRELTEREFYNKLAIVDQNVKLFEGTIFDNITMWDKSIDYETVVKAAKDAGIHDDIMKRSGGYFGNVFAGGKNLSGGQRQKIEIARALAKNPRILILDEATSALDTIVEAEIMKNIKARGITLIIIAHRLSTIRDCDEIIVMCHGKIAERGTHDSLMKLNGK